MASFEFDDPAGLGLSLEELANIPDDVKAAILAAEADVIEPAIKQSAKASGASPHGRLAGFIKRKAKKDKNGLPYVDIYPDGIYRKNKNGTKTRAAEVAFIREYGIARRKIPATSFMDKALRTSADKAVDAGMKVYDQFLTKKGF